MTSTTPTPMCWRATSNQARQRPRRHRFVSDAELERTGGVPDSAWHAKCEAATVALIDWYERSNAPDRPRTGEAGRETQTSSASGNYAPGVHPILKRFLAFEDRFGAEMLLEAIEHRRYGTRTMEFNCFDVEIDADAESVTIVEIVADNGARAVIPVEELRRDLRDRPA